MGETILCLCRDVTVADVEDAVGRGFTDPETIKRYTAAFTGPCQGRACAEVILDEIARLTGVPRERLAATTARPPVFGVRLGELAGESAPDRARERAADGS